MKIEEISYVSVRVIAIFLFLLGMSQLVNLLQFTIPTYMQLIDPNEEISRVIIPAALPSAIILLTSIVCWFSAGKISLLLVPTKVSEEKKMIDSNGLEGFVLSAIGLVIVIFSFTTAIRYLIDIIISSSNSEYLYLYRPNVMYPFIEQALRFIIGLILVVKANGFAMLLRKIRGFGLKDQQEKNEET